MLTIAWDVDDVLNDLMRSWFKKKWLIDNTTCTIKYEDLIENPPHRIINTTKEEYIQSLDSFRVSQDYIKIKPNKEVLEWFKEYGKKARHIILTAVPLNSANISANWVINNFGQWIRSFNFIPSKRNDIQIPEYDKNKQEFLKWFGKIDIFIEDNEKNISGVTEQNVKSLLVSQPWNKSKDNIQEVLAKITKMIEEEKQKQK